MPSSPCHKPTHASSIASDDRRSYRDGSIRSSDDACEDVLGDFFQSLWRAGVDIGASPAPTRVLGGSLRRNTVASTSSGVLFSLAKFLTNADLCLECLSYTMKAGFSATKLIAVKNSYVLSLSVVFASMKIGLILGPHAPYSV